MKTGDEDISCRADGSLHTFARSDYIYSDRREFDCLLYENLGYSGLDRAR